MYMYCIYPHTHKHTHTHTYALLTHPLIIYNIISYSYNDVDDEHRGTNILITADESFNSIQSRKITVK